ncbi:hypothetical protein RHPLAN_49980 [Rhodoplanes sp. Z2-YC6860]|nr:hypothetical protein RHPLAN_49980 [Rhodoplanes sp. Z2-YC6860]
MLTRALAIASMLMLGGCAMSGLLPDWTSNDAAGPEPAYKFLIANKLKEIIGNAAPTDTLEISKADRLESLKGASWRVCVKAQKFLLPPRYYAVFFQRDEMVDSRLSVLIDQCEIQSFSAFDWKTEANKPPPAR